MYDNELYHFGIKGMKWGIRRYQNPDGTLTPEGKKRYGVNDIKTYKNRKSIVSDFRKQEQRIAEKLEKEHYDRVNKDYEDFTNNRLTPIQEKRMYEKYKKYDTHSVGDLNSGDLWDNAFYFDAREGRKKAYEMAKEYVNSKYNVNIERLTFEDQEKIDRGALFASMALPVIGLLAVSLYEDSKR